jgi:MoaA/NifB/PqqE/SkfB family radical SAM enzyme
MVETTARRLCDPHELKRVIGGRELYFWGARHGYGMCRVFERLGMRPKGFIDSSKAMVGSRVLDYEVHLPDEILGNGRRPYIVITSSFYADEISGQCRGYGLVEEEDFIPFTRIQRFDYQVDISGACNLRCISCPRGNMPQQPPAGYMSAAIYKQVLDKILREDPFTGVVTLYNWGEPLLNPDLAVIVAYSNERNVLTAISSNLNVRRDFSDVIKAKPMWFRISLSGFEKTYEITHTGGSWELLLENMHKLKAWRAQYHPNMAVEMFYHIYRHNNREDFHKMRQLCKDLGFTFRYRHAALAPLDNIEAIVEGRAVSEAARAAMSMQILPVSEAMDIARQQIDGACHYERCLWIRWDCAVAQCMEWYADNKTLVPGGFLDTPLDEIAAARENNTFCEECKRKAIHRCYVVYGDENLITQRKSVDLNTPSPTA